MNAQAIIDKETQLREALKTAEETYKAESLKLRCEIARSIRHARESAGVNTVQASALLGCNRQKVFSSENPEKVPNPFSVSELLTMLQTMEALASAMSTVPKIPRKKPGTKAA